LALIVLGLVIFPALCPAPIVWKPGEGFESEGGSAAGSAKETLEVAQKLETGKDYSEAMKTYRAGARKFPYSFSAAELHFGWGRMLEIDGDFAKSFDVYQKVVEKYPNSPFFDQALERQFNIANLFLAGERQKLWKIPTLPSMEKTVEYYEKIVKSAPYSKWATEAQFKIGVAKERQKNWGDSVEAYQKILEKYPDSEMAALAQYQIGYAWMKASRDADYDQSAAEKSIHAFEDFMTRYPNHEKFAQAKDNIGSMRGRQEHGSYNIARFYDKKGDRKAALIYYNEVIEQNPDSELARTAAKRAEEIKLVLKPDDVKNLPQPSAAAVSTASKTPSKGETGPPTPNDLPQE